MAEKIKMYEIDGHHIRFNCCDNTLAILYNESDSLSEPKACPFCGMTFDVTDNVEITLNRHGKWNMYIPEQKEASLEYTCSVCGHVISLRPAMIQRFPRACPSCMATMD